MVDGKALWKSCYYIGCSAWNWERILGQTCVHCDFLATLSHTWVQNVLLVQHSIYLIYRVDSVQSPLPIQTLEFIFFMLRPWLESHCQHRVLRILPPCYRQSLTFWPLVTGLAPTLSLTKVRVHTSLDQASCSRTGSWPQLP